MAQDKLKELTDALDQLGGAITSFKKSGGMNKDNESLIEQATTSAQELFGYLSNISGGKQKKSCQLTNIAHRITDK